VPVVKIVSPLLGLETSAVSSFGLISFSPLSAGSNTLGRSRGSIVAEKKKL